MAKNTTLERIAKRIKKTTLASLEERLVRMELLLEAWQNAMDPARSKGVKSAIEQIQLFVAGQYHTTLEDIAGKARTHDVLVPRYVAIHLCRKLLRSPLHTIGHAFHRDHTSILNALDQIERWMKGDAELKADVARYEKQLQELLKVHLKPVA